jgi:DHA2 family multidrug resistance protein
MSDAAGSAHAPDSRPDYFATGWTGGHNPWVIALVVTMATFMEVLDTSIANVSLPHIAGDLSVSQDESTWVLTSYLVSNAIVLPISGWLSTKMGRKRFYMTCVTMFTVSSFLCGIAPSLGTLIFFRILQGIGGGGLGPSEQAILADTFPPARRGMAMAIYGMAVVLAPAIGPTLGGYITDNFSWRWVFFVNVPVGILSLILSNRFVTDPPHLTQARARAVGAQIDWLGLGLVAIALGCFEFVLDKGQEDDWFHAPVITWFSVVSATSFVAFVVWEWNHPNPVVDLRMLKRRSFAVSNILMLMLGIALFGSTVLLPQYLQVLMGYTAQQSGMALSPGGLVVICLLPLVGRSIGKVDTRLLAAFGFAVLSGSLLFMANTVDLKMDFATAVELRAIQSVGLAFLFVPINTISYGGIQPQKYNQVSGIMNLSRNIGGDIGIAFVTTLIARRSQVHENELGAQATMMSSTYQARLHALAHALQHAGSGGAQSIQKASGMLYRQLIVQATQLAYLDALRVLAFATALMVPLVWLAGRQTTQRAPAAH